MENAAKKGQLPFKFYCVTDRDSGLERPNYASVNTFSWDVYHIENYFLEPSHIRKVVTSLGEKDHFLTDDALWDELRSCAQETLPQLIRHELSAFANDVLVSAIDTGTDPKGSDVAGLLAQAVERSALRFEDARKRQLSQTALAEKEIEIRAKYVKSLADGTWTSVCRGRDVIRRFVAKHASSVSYEVFRNLLLYSMRDAGHKPAGMDKVVKQILRTD